MTIKLQKCALLIFKWGMRLSFMVCFEWLLIVGHCHRRTGCYFNHFVGCLFQLWCSRMGWGGMKYIHILTVSFSHPLQPSLPSSPRSPLPESFNTSSPVSAILVVDGSYTLQFLLLNTLIFLSCSLCARSRIQDMRCIYIWFRRDLLFISSKSVFLRFFFFLPKNAESTYLHCRR
jgi:hypothetical protein